MKHLSKEIINKALEYDLVKLIESKGITLTKHGAEFKTNCPFPDHEDKNPSFFVNPKKKLYKCFGCNRSGNAINFLVDYSGLQFYEAVKYLLELSGQSYLLAEEKELGQNENAGQGEKGKAKSENANNNLNTETENVEPKKDNLQFTIQHSQLLNRVIDFYHKTFKNSPEAQKYLIEERKIKGSEIFETFKIGYVDGSLLKTLGKKSNVKDELKTLGILTENNTEFFYKRIVIPIFNEQNEIINIYGRNFSNASNSVKHLYLRGSQRGVFNFSAVKRSKEIILCESILDALSAISNGFTETIPLYGVNGLTNDHLELFKENLVEKIIFCFDNDKAGKEAIPKNIEKLKHLPLNFSKIVLPDYSDLNEYFQIYSANDFQKLVETAETLKNIEHVETQQNTAFETNSENKNYTIEVNGDEIIFSSDNIEYTVRGLNVYAFTRMKVNIRAKKNTAFHIDTIDLFASKSRAAFVNQCAKRFEVPTQIIEVDMFYLIKELEKIRKEKIKSDENKNKINIPEMTSDGQKEALNFLTNKNLIQELLNDFLMLGYVGEETNKIIGYVVSVSRKLNDPLACIVLSRSGGGKSTLIENVEMLTPPEDLVQFSNLTPQALYYMDKDELAHKLLLIEERSSAEAADSSIRELQSKKILRKGVPIKDPNTGSIKTIRLEVNGPVSYMESTTNHNINPENTNRCFILHIDESSEQTRRIQESQRKSKTIEGIKQKLKISQIKIKHHNAQRLLKPLSVFNPFSNEIKFPSEILRTRRDNFRFLNLIEAITFLHQFQRQHKEMTDESTGEIVEYIESTIDDYRIAYNIIKDILDTTLDEVPKNSRDLLNLIHDYIKEKSKQNKIAETDVSFTRREIREFTKWSDDQIKNHIRKLEEMEYLYIEKGTKGQQYLYKAADAENCGNDLVKQIPTPEEIERILKNSKKIV